VNPQTPQEWIDDVLETSPQQWLLRLIAVVTPVMAVLAASAANGRAWPVGMSLVAGLALTSSLRPDADWALAVIVIVGWHWLAAVDEVDTIWLPLASVLLLVFHTVVALLATVPSGGVVPTITLARWAGRVAVGAGATVGLWLMVVALDQRDARGNALLTALALAVVAGAAVLIRARSLGPRSQQV